MCLPSEQGRTGNRIRVQGGAAQQVSAGADPGGSGGLLRKTGALAFPPSTRQLPSPLPLPRSTIPALRATGHADDARRAPLPAAAGDEAVGDAQAGVRGVQQDLRGWGLLLHGVSDEAEGGAGLLPHRRGGGARRHVALPLLRAAGE